MAKNIVPQLLRAPLDSVILASKMLHLGEPPKAILALAMNPPNLRNIESTVWSLKEARQLSSKQQFAVYTYHTCYVYESHLILNSLT